MKEDEVGKACRRWRYGTDKKYIQKFWLESLKRRDQVEGLGINWRVILKGSLRNRV
jgi:hypothetical protein